MKILLRTMMILAATLLFSAAVWAESVPFDDTHWDFSEDGVRLEVYKGMEAVAILNGEARSKTVAFQNGVIEFDILVQNARSFSGIHFREESQQSREHFYLRPVQSGRPDANQYTPIFSGDTGWQLYHGPEFSSPTVYKFDEWMHVRLVIAGSRMDVYIDSDEPILRVPQLKRVPVAGSISVSSGLSEARFANVSVTEMDSPPITEMEVSVPEHAAGLITKWNVSSPIISTSLESKVKLTEADYEGLTWQDAEVEGPGFVNIGRYAIRDAAAGIDTVLMRTTVTAEEARPGIITFGYSDRARVYVNSKLVYSGDNGYRTRDVRYLGTIGLFDSVHVPLRAGDNHVVIAISESFGGWGVIAKVD